MIVEENVITWESTINIKTTVDYFDPRVTPNGQHLCMGNKQYCEFIEEIKKKISRATEVCSILEL